MNEGRLQREQTVLHLAVQSSTPSSLELVGYLLHAHGGRLLERPDDSVRSSFPSSCLLYSRRWRLPGGVCTPAHPR